MARDERAYRDMEWLFDAAKRQLDDSGIDRAVAAFAPVLSEFEAYTEGVAIPEPYRERLSRFISFLKTAFDLPTEVMLVQSGKYMTDMWGPLYWSFLHYASILLQHALYAGLADDVKDFPTLVYNIEMMLPCGICISHYSGIKRRNSNVLYAIKLISFGHVVQGVYQFHGAIAENIHRQRRDANASAFRPFTPIDFARLYGCYPLTTVADGEHKSSAYSQPIVDRQTPLHLSVSLIVVIRYGVSYSRVSNYLKRAYGLARASYPAPPAYTVEDERFERDTTLYDLYDAVIAGLRQRPESARPKSESDDDKEAILRRAADAVRAAFAAHGRGVHLGTANAAFGNDALGDDRREDAERPNKKPPVATSGRTTESLISSNRTGASQFT